ncbi:MAG: T9SS type A sorting domain-containing protein [Bacteroidales bacterium]|nr:T9SS type A sorting domain-containing protein [Bacteroidales bacterium]
MKRYTIIFLIFISAISLMQAQTVSFPGAEGDGMFTTGGRGGSVLYVTKLTDDGSIGTFRWAINQTGARTVLFKVAGLIPLTSELRIKNGNLTVAGQTAPGDGICLKNYPVVVQASNVIIRFMRFRMGDEAAAADKLAGNTAYGWDGADAIWGRNLSNIIIDHCSMSWNIDECSSFYDNQNFTLQWCIMAESMRNSVHSKGAHGYGGIWGGEPASFHHNILAFHDSRNPRFCGSRYTNSPSTQKVNFVNNVIYNWGGNSGYAGEGGSYNILNNYYRSGIARSTGVVSYRIFSPNGDDGSNSQPAGIWGVFYLNGNVMHNYSAVTNDNSIGFQPVNLGAKSINDITSSTPFAIPQLTVQSANEAYNSVTSYAGASLRRDSVDKRIVRNILNGTVSCTAGSNGSTGGFIDSQKDVGGWPAYNYDLASVPVDSDGDGMPDSWEIKNGLNTALADGNGYNLSIIYTNLEVYLNELVESVVNLELSSVSEKRDESFLMYPNPLKVGDEIHIKTPKLLTKIQIISTDGVLLKNELVTDNMVVLSLKGVPRGIYIVKCEIQKGSSYTSKLMIK